VQAASAMLTAPKFPPQSARPDVGLDHVCLICRCKFARASTLDRHKLQSKLHKVHIQPLIFSRGLLTLVLMNATVIMIMRLPRITWSRRTKQRWNRSES
jgi:hypothetical protein